MVILISDLSLLVYILSHAFVFASKHLLTSPKLNILVTRSMELIGTLLRVTTGSAKFITEEYFAQIERATALHK